MPRLIVSFGGDLRERLMALPEATDDPASFVRRLVIEALAGVRSVRAAPPIRGRSVMISLSLTPRDAACLDREASRIGLPRATWLAALVARRFRGEARFNQADEVALVGIQMELRRLALGLVRLAEPTADGQPLGAGPSVDIQGLAALAAEVRGHMASIREALAGNLDYWRTDDG